MNGNIQNHFMLQKQGERGVSGYIQNHLMLKENRGEGIEWYYSKSLNVTKTKGRGDWASECDHYLYSCHPSD